MDLNSFAQEDEDPYYVGHDLLVNGSQRGYMTQNVFSTNMNEMALSGQAYFTNNGSQDEHLSLGLSQDALQELDAFTASHLTSGGPDPFLPIATNNGELLQMFSDDAIITSYGPSRSIIGNKYSGKKVFEEGTSAEENEQNEAVSSSQSSDISQESTIPSLIPYPGKYMFRVELVENVSKKAVFFKEQNKVFCLQNEKILFNFHLSCSRSAMKDLQVRSMLVYPDNAHIMKPVKRCITCLDEEAKKVSRELTSVEENSKLHHVLRCDHDSAVHEISNAQKRYMVTVPLEKAQLGSTGVARNFEFACMNSCKEINRKPLNILFLLIENGHVVGRYVMDLKVCRCPKRDYDIEKKKLEKTTQKKERKRGHGSQDSDKDTKIDVRVKPPSKKRCESPPSVHNLSIKCEPHAEQEIVQPGLRAFQAQQNSDPTDDSEIEFTSQNSQESFETTTVKKIADGIKLFRGLQKSPNVDKQVIAKQSLQLLKMFHKNVKDYKKIEATQAPYGGPDPNGPSVSTRFQTRTDGHGSPDSGVNTKTP